MSYTIGFADADAQTNQLVGGKGANLGRLVTAGFPVPPGFTVSVAAYRTFMREAGLQDTLTALLGSLEFGNADAVSAALDTFREQIVATAMPAEVETEIRAAFNVHIEKGVRVAVRSSGTAEDLAEASFAGMHDTYLDILGPDEVVASVKRCWASLWTARATTYRHDKDFDQSVIGLAVVIQTMVSAEASGVMFTANPLTANTAEIVINASWGLGEAIVAGLVTPDEYILSGRTLQMHRRAIARKDKQIVREDGGGTRLETIPEERQENPTLTDEQAAELGEIGRRVMGYYDGLPQDIEWAMADGRFYVLQSRDVTGVDFTWDEDVEATVGFLEPYVQHDPEQNDEILWTNNWAREFWNGAITPLFYTIRVATRNTVITNCTR